MCLSHFLVKFWSFVIHFWLLWFTVTHTFMAVNWLLLFCCPRLNLTSIGWRYVCILLQRNVPEPLCLILCQYSWVRVLAHAQNYLGLLLLLSVWVLTGRASLLNINVVDILLLPCTDLPLRPVTDGISFSFATASVWKMLLVDCVFLWHLAARSWYIKLLLFLATYYNSPSLMSIMLLLLDRISTCRPLLGIRPDAQITCCIQRATLFVVDSLTQMYGACEFTVFWMVRSNVGRCYCRHRSPCWGCYLLTTD